jgi:hypothetical protein
MQLNTQQRKRTIHEATYALLKRLSQQMEPVTLLAQQTSPLPDEPHPMDTMIDLLQQLVGGIEQVHLRLENLEARLDDPAVVKAIKDAVRG